MLTFLLQYTAGSQCTDDQIVGMLLGALFAGQHTSSISSTWMVLRLLDQPKLMARCMQEMVTVLGTNDPNRSDVMSMANVQQLNFMHNCMKEALRMAPPLIMLMRMTHQPVTVGKHTIPVGHYVFVSPAVTMNLEDGDPDQVFTRPHEFLPDRYEAPMEEDKKKPFGYCAFGGGKHGCLGEQFGYLQVKTIVAMLLRRFELEAMGPLPEPNYQAMVVGPVQANNSTRVRYRLRKTPLPYTPVTSTVA
jgi:sterol 14-demethylase